MAITNRKHINQRLVLLFLLAFAGLPFFTGSVLAKETLIWAVTPFPPGYITEGPDRGTGYADELERFMVEHLPQYNHQRRFFPNWERSLGQIKNGPLLCTSILFYRTPDDRAPIKGAYEVSAPSGVFFLHDIIVKKEKRHLFGDQVSFEALLKNPSFRFGYNRPYGVTLNRILSDYIGLPAGTELDAMDPLKRIEHLRKAKNIAVRTGADMIDGMIRMLLSDRVDYILEYDFMMKYQQKKLGLGDKLVTIPISEVNNQISRLAYACSDTMAGRKAIKAINSVLVKHRHTEKFKKALQYLVPKGREDIYWQEYNKILSINE